MTFDSGLLTTDLLLMRRVGTKETLVSFRQAGRVGIWLEGSSEPLRVPLPPLLLIRTQGGKQTQHALFAVKARPTTLDTALFHAPLPNIYPHGNICWGSVRVMNAPLHDDWQALLGTPFGNHSVAGKSRQHSDDIRHHLLSLAERGSRTYPKRDLVATGKTLAQQLGDLS